MKAKFPKTIYVSQEEPANDDPYLTISDDAFEGFDETREVAIYRLVEVGEVTVDRRFRVNGKEKKA